MEVSMTLFELSYVQFLVGYLCGSIPFGLILTRLFKLGDIRSIGSGNIGATNVLRTGNKKIAAATLVLDMLKGTLPVLLIAHLTHDPLSGCIAGFGAFFGHTFPVWLKFKGGKGVATYLGVICGLSVALFGIAIGIWLAIAAIFRYSSLAALMMAIGMPVVFFFVAESHYISIILALMSAIIFVRHRQNIKRLLSGTEPKIGQKS
jgi:glycerol-3-phosphate acyltransferase PlsY